MVTIFHGKINSGKTTALMRYYKSTLKGDGFLSIKTMVGSSVKCYEALELSTGKTYALAYHENYRPDSFRRTLTLGPYSFNESIFLHIENYIEKCISNNISPIYLDEIGNLELSSQGYSEILKVLLQKDVDIIIGIRSDLVSRIIEEFHIHDYFLKEILKEGK